MTELQNRIIVGLGNPGPKYAQNRHNIGFMVLDEVVRREKLIWRAGAANYARAVGEGYTLIKPLTYMNLSGEALVSWSTEAGVPLNGRPLCPPEPDAEEIPLVGNGEDPGVRPLVVCDDLALPLGSVRLRARGSSGGQNGLGSIIDHLAGEEFPRLRLGIAPLSEPLAPQDWPDYVLTDFTEAEKTAMEDLVSHAADALACWLEHGLEVTVSRFNRRIRPQD